MGSDLFGGGGSESTSVQQSGFAALPSGVQNELLEAIRYGSDLALGNPAQYFAPMGLTSEEQLAQSMIDPSQIGSNIQNYLNPYADYAIEGINQQFESPQSALQAAANEAGAFGSSRYRDVAGDLEQARLGAIGQNLGSQYNTAFNQMQTGIGNLLGFGGLERGVDLAQRQAPIQAASYASGLYTPLLNTGTSTQTQTSGGGGILGGLGSLGGFLETGQSSGLFDYFGLGGGSDSGGSFDSAGNVISGDADSGDYFNTALDAAKLYFGF